MLDTCSKVETCRSVSHRRSSRNSMVKHITRRRNLNEDRVLKVRARESVKRDSVFWHILSQRKWVGASVKSAEVRRAPFQDEMYTQIFILCKVDFLTWSISQNSLHHSVSLLLTSSGQRDALSNSAYHQTSSIDSEVSSSVHNNAWIRISCGIA